MTKYLPLAFLIAVMTIGHLYARITNPVKLEQREALLQEFERTCEATAHLSGQQKDEMDAKLRDITQQRRKLDTLEIGAERIFLLLKNEWRCDKGVTITSF